MNVFLVWRDDEDVLIFGSLQRAQEWVKKNHYWHTTQEQIDKCIEQQEVL